MQYRDYLVKQLGEQGATALQEKYRTQRLPSLSAMREKKRKKIQKLYKRSALMRKLDKYL